jgi:small nuclear ribonucleoprotein (snRNP)-like protein
MSFNRNIYGFKSEDPSSSLSSSSSSSLISKKREREINDDNDDNDNETIKTTSLSLQKRIRNEDNDKSNNKSINKSINKLKVIGHGGENIIYKNPNSLKTHKSTVCVIAALLGQYICIELKNDKELYGKVNHVDHQMNIELIDVQLKPSLLTYDNYFVNGNTIRYIHIPKNIDIKKSVKVINFIIIYYILFIITHLCKNIIIVLDI